MKCDLDALRICMGRKDVTHVPADCDQKTIVGDHVQVHYKGSLEDGTVFDSSFGRSPIGFQIGAGRVIAGWEQGLLNMCVGEKRTLTIPPELGYGASGIGPIPPNSVLVFDVELVEVYRPHQEL
ncbi:Peptidyl-prolyl cis-trans isomerase fpr2 [Candidozyma auris]